jgi:prepilin peptidase CpaA
MDISVLASGAALHWDIWLVSIVLIVAAVIDGRALKVPNWITFPFILAGWAYSIGFYGLDGLWWSLAGTAIGLGLLLPAYAIGGMGAGDVKLLAGVGAWVYGTHTFYAFCWSAIIGAILAVSMVLARKAWTKHSNQFWMIFNEIVTIKDPEVLAGIAAQRKSSMLLLPYGIPICIGTILYFAWMGLFV